MITYQKKKVDIIGFSETNVEWNQRLFQRRFLLFLQKYDSQVKLSTTTSSLRFDSLYKPGGTCTIANGNTNGFICETIQDYTGLGRWSGFVLQRRHHKKLLIMTAYRVPNQTINNVGPLTAYYQQYTILNNKHSHTIIDPRKKFITDLTKLLSSYITTNTDIILMIDANESMGDESHGIASLCRKCKLIDPIAHQHGCNDELATHNRGTTQIDYILISDTLIPMIKRSGILPFNEAAFSDHRALHLTLDYRMIFNGEYQIQPEHQKRGINSKRPKLVRRYRELL